MGRSDRDRERRIVVPIASTAVEALWTICGSDPWPALVADNRAPYDARGVLDSSHGRCRGPGRAGDCAPGRATDTQSGLAGKGLSWQPQDEPILPTPRGM